MICISYIYDSATGCRFCDHICFTCFDEFDNYISLCDAHGYIIECIVNLNTNIVYYNDQRR